MEMTENTLKAVDELRSSRRAAIMMGGAALAGLALARTAQAQAAAVTDTDILNFALNLEYLEAQYYTLATTGLTIDQLSTPISTSSGATPPVAGGTVTVKTGAQVPFVSGGLLQAYAMETALEERNHVIFLKTTLAANGVAQPNIDLLNSFNALAVAAGLGASFDPFASESNFLLGAFIFEDVGVTAYLGAAAAISNTTYLDKAAGILAVEAYHAGSIRTQIFRAGSSLQASATAIAHTRAQLDGTNNDDIGVGVDSTGAATIVDADSTNAMAFSRTTGQVLSIVYGGGAAGVGGAFFPNGLNGNIK